MELRTAILKTIIYFDCLDYPLTVFEVWKFLFFPGSQKVSLEAILSELYLMVGQGAIKEGCGYYFLGSRDELLLTRRGRHRLSISKMTRARSEAKRFVAFPHILGVAMGNSLALRNSGPAGDIDFFLITRAGHVWASRLVTTAYSAALDKRARPDKKQDQNCLCFYVSEQALNLREFLLPDKFSLPDIYFIYWLATLAPILGSDILWRRFRQANAWVEQYLPNINFKNSESLSKTEPAAPGPIEQFSRWAELAVLAPPLRALKGNGTAVIQTNEVIKLHQNDGRELIRKHYLDQLHAHGF